MLKQLALAAALAAPVATPIAAKASSLPAYPFVHVSAEASRYATPDIGTIDFLVGAVEAELTADALREARRRAEIIARGARRKLGAVTAVSPGGIKNLGAAMGVVRTDFSYQRSRPANVGARDFLSVDALKLMQPVDVVFKLE